MAAKGNFLILILIVFNHSTFGQQYQTRLYDKVEVETVQFLDTLRMDIYQAQLDSNISRPIILFVHGGGFYEGTRDRQDIKQFCQNMARRGIVVASMDYTLVMEGQSFGCDQPAPNKLAAFKHVGMEVVGATNFLLKQAVKLRINKKHVILAGTSAGAESALYAAYAKESFTSLPDDFRYGGLINMAGAIADIDLITRESAIPMQFFHGTCDDLVPYGNAPHHYCREQEVGYLPLYGSGAIVEKLKNLKKGYFLITACSGNHDWADIAFREYAGEIAAFVENDVVRGNFRQIHHIIESEDTCEIVDNPGICSSN